MKRLGQFPATRVQLYPCPDHCLTTQTGMVMTATAGYYSRQVCWNTSAVRYALHNVDLRTTHLQKTRDSESGKEGKSTER